MKTCTKCDTLKELSEFGPRKANRDGLRSDCKTCRASEGRLYRQMNRDKYLNSQTKYRKSHSDLVKLREASWVQRNRGRKNAANMLRYCRKLEATPPWLSDEQKAVIEDFYNEAARLTEETGVQHEVDHIMPLQGKISRGLHVPWNLQILTRSVNASKGNR